VPVVGSVYATVMVDLGGFTRTLVVLPHFVHALELGGAIVPSRKLAPQPANVRRAGIRPATRKLLDLGA
jgi:hypothetical protein